MKYFIYCFKHYADFKGRARRSEYWWFVLFYVLITLLPTICWYVPIVKAMLLGYSDMDFENGAELMANPEIVKAMLNPFLFVLIIWGLAALVPNLAVQVRRLHDIGRSGNWLILYYGISFVLGLLGNIWMLSSSSIFSIIIFLLTLAVSICYLVWMFTDSQYGPNPWGPNPKGEGNAVETEQQPTETEQSE